MDSGRSIVPVALHLKPLFHRHTNPLHVLELNRAGEEAVDVVDVGEEHFADI